MAEKGKTGSPNKLDRIISLVGGLLALYQLIIASRVLTWFGVFLPAAQHRAISLFFALILIYAMRSFYGKTRQARLTWYDILFLVGGLANLSLVLRAQRPG